MKAQEHRTLGDVATGAAPVDVGGVFGGEALVLSFGDVVALSGDYFVADGYPVVGAPGVGSNAEALPPRGCSSWPPWPVNGARGAELETRSSVPSR